MPRALLKDTCQIAAEILDGQHDANLDYIGQAIKARRHSQFRKGSTVRLHGTHNPSYEGRTGIVLKVNTKTVTVGVGEKDQFGYETELNVPPHMLVAVERG